MTVDELFSLARSGSLGPDPDGMTATSVFWLQHGTRLPGAQTTSLTRYVVVRVGTVFGACAFETGEIDPDVCARHSGRAVAELLDDAPPAVRLAALDAYLASVTPHPADPRAEAVTLPSGTPAERAHARDSAVAGLLDLLPGDRVALIGVVDPLVAAIRDRGGVCLPCDFTRRPTRWGDPVTDDMTAVLDRADSVVATGMTLGNGTFDRILTWCGRRNVPLTVYAQTGSAVARAFVGAGVRAVSAEPFPFSQFSAESTVLYRYRAREVA